MIVSIQPRLLCALMGLLLAAAPSSAQMIERSRLPVVEPHLTSAAGGMSGPQQAEWVQPYFDLEAYEAAQNQYLAGSDAWHWQSLPDRLLYPSYLAGIKEPRMATGFTYIREDGWLWEPTVGGRIGLIRFGTRDALTPVGMQLDAEGSAQLRLDPDENMDVRSVDFRGGLPLTFAYGRHRTKIAYYHMSSHLGDEFLLKNPTFVRLNWARDALVLGHAVMLTDNVKIYGEAGWAFYTDVSEQWEFQAGLDYAPAMPTGFHGAPFFALNGHLREEVDFGGNLTVQAGWAWRDDDDGRLLRLGFQYYNGESSQNSFFDDFEESYGIFAWYDY